MHRTEYHRNLFTLDEFLTPEYCQALIAQSEERGYEGAKINMGGVQVKNTSVRNNQRCFWKTEEFARVLFEKLEPHIPARRSLRLAVGLNELLRFYKYDPGQRFRPHIDGAYQAPNGDLSYFTFMVYLNDDFEGGETGFGEDTIVPKTGMALIFNHKLRHEGLPVTAGTKYVLRSDIMYRLDPSSPELINSF